MAKKKHPGSTVTDIDDLLQSLAEFDTSVCAEKFVISPVVTHYYGSSAALRATKVLPAGLVFPEPADDRSEAREGWCSKSWVRDGTEFWLCKRAVDGAHHLREDYRPDSWWLCVRNAHSAQRV